MSARGQKVLRVALEEWRALVRNRVAMRASLTLAALLVTSALLGLEQMAARVEDDVRAEERHGEALRVGGGVEEHREDEVVARRCESGGVGVRLGARVPALRRWERHCGRSGGGWGADAEGCVAEDEIRAHKRCKRDEEGLGRGRQDG